MFAAATAIAVAHTSAQTVTLANTGGTFTTVQAAINSFAGDVDPAANLIQITDS